MDIQSRVGDFRKKVISRKGMLLSAIILSFIPLFFFWKLPLGLVGDTNLILMFYFGELTSIIGLIGAMLLFWQYVLGFRLFAASFTKDLIWINNIHKSIGIYGFLLIAFHPIAALLSYGADWFELIFPKQLTLFDINIFYGKTAFLIITFIWITSALFRRKLPFRLWKQIHYLNYLVLPLILIHSLSVGTTLTSTGLVYYWYVIAIITGIIILLKLIRWSGILQRKYNITQITEVALNIKTFELTPGSGSYITPLPGQFIYIQLAPFGEIHPFTVSGFDEQTKKLKITPKKEGKFTSQLHQTTIGTHLSIEGPYGVFTHEALVDNKPAIFLAGGIGITPFMNTLKSVKVETILFYSIQTQRDIAFKEQLTQLQSQNSNIHIFYNLTKEEGNHSEFHNGRITEIYLKNKVKSLSEYSYFICGPKPFIKSMIALLKQNSIQSQDIFTEEFSL